PLDVDPVRAHARLPAVQECGPEAALDGAVEVGVREDEHRILAPQLEHDRAEALRGGDGDRATSARAACEEDLRNARIPCDRLAGLTSSVDDANEPRSRARLHEHALDPVARARRVLRRLEDDAVPRDDG